MGEAKEKREILIKLGRPVTYVREDGIPGMPITADIRRIFLRGIEVNHKNGVTLEQVYQAIMESSFFQGFEMKNGVTAPKLLPPESRPTFRQFEYYFHKNWEKDLINNARKYYGSREYDQKLRELTGSSNQMAIGPGAMYQIDLTLVDIYLRAFFDRFKGRWPPHFICFD